MKSNIKVSMIGCGNLGLNCAEVMADYYDVVGYDLVDKSPSNFSMVDSIEHAVIDRDIIFIAVTTPHDALYGGETPSSHLIPKDFSYENVIAALKEINKFVKKSQLVVLISTVLTGTIRNNLSKYLANGTLVYNPYLISMGSVKKDMVSPEMVIIGNETGSTDSVKKLVEFYSPILKSDTRYEIGTWEEAESIKIFYNTFISMKLSFVNMIQDVAELTGNMNVDKVSNALIKSTKNISGPGYLKPGLVSGGACHPRDNSALRFLASKLNLEYDLFETIAKSRESQSKNIAAKCLQYGNSVCIVGKAYKESVEYTAGSPSLLIGHYIKELGGELYYYDVNTGDTTFPKVDVYLIAHWDTWVEKIEWPYDSTLIDIKRKIDKSKTFRVIHYGNTRL